MSPIEEYPLSSALDTGIRYETLIPGLVPLYEEREAAVFTHYNRTNWLELDSTERATSVAHYRLHRLIELHNNDAIADEMRRRGPKGSKGKG